MGHRVEREEGRWRGVSDEGEDVRGIRGGGGCVTYMVDGREMGGVHVRRLGEVHLPGSISNVLVPSLLYQVYHRKTGVEVWSTLWTGELSLHCRFQKSP